MVFWSERAPLSAFLVNMDKGCELAMMTMAGISHKLPQL